MTSFEQLPIDLIDQILEYIEQDVHIRAKTYRCLSRTSKAVRLAVIPFLYRRCNLSAQSTFAKCVTSLRANPGLAQHFKELKLEETSQLNMQQISKVDLENLSTVLANAGDIDHVMTTHFKKAVYHGSVESHIALICALATRVEQISLQTRFTAPGTGKRHKTQLPCLSRMMRHAIAHQTSPTYNGPLNSLRSVELKSHKDSPITWELLQILCEMPTLGSLTLRLDGTRGQSSAKHLPIVDLQARSNLKSFTYHGFKLDYRAITVVICRCKSLQSIEICWTDDTFGRNEIFFDTGLTSVLMYLMKHKDSLRSLKTYADGSHAAEYLGTLKPFRKLEELTLNMNVLMSAVDLYIESHSQSYTDFLPPNIKLLTIPDWFGDSVCAFIAEIAMTAPPSLDSVVMIVRPRWFDPARLQSFSINSSKFFSIVPEDLPEHHETQTYGFKIVVHKLSYIKQRFQNCERESLVMDLDEELLNWDSDGDEPADEARRESVKKSGMIHDFNELQYIMNRIWRQHN